MNHLNRRALECWQRLDHCLIDSGRALATTHHQNCAQLFMKTEPLTRHPLIDALKLFANWCAGYFGADSWKKGSTLFDAEKHSADKAGRNSIRLTGNGIRFVNEGGNPAHLAREDWCGGGKAAHS